MWIRGEEVILHLRTQTGVDPFGAATYEDSTVTVENVLIEPASAEAVVNDLQLFGKHTSYTLHIPRDDPHTWTDTVVEFRGKAWRTFGEEQVWQENLTPLAWGRKIRVEAYG